MSNNWSSVPPELQAKARRDAEWRARNEIARFRRHEDRMEWANALLRTAMRPYGDNGPTSIAVNWEPVANGVVFRLADGQRVFRGYPPRLFKDPEAAIAFYNARREEDD